MKTRVTLNVCRMIEQDAEFGEFQKHINHSVVFCIYYLVVPRVTLSRFTLQGVSILAPELTFNTISTVRSRCAVSGAGTKAYFEVEVNHPGNGTQFGFCSPDFASDPGYLPRGTGDDKHSLGADGSRVLRWHDANSDPFGSEWRAGDVIGFAVDLGDADVTAGRMLVSLNGDFSSPYGVALDLPPGLPAVYAALTAGSGRLTWNLGGVRAFRFAPPSPDYQAFATVAAAPAP
jgi:hypothetical protein